MRFGSSSWVGLVMVSLCGCAYAHRKGDLPDGREVWRIDCGGQCQKRSARICRGYGYTILEEHNTADGRQQVVACNEKGRDGESYASTAPPPGFMATPMPLDETQLRGAAISAGDPLASTADVRCKYWREHLYSLADTPTTGRLRQWIAGVEQHVCAQVAPEPPCPPAAPIAAPPPVAEPPEPPEADVTR